MPENNDLNKRFDDLEKKLEAIALHSPLSNFHSPNSRSDEIDLRELWNILWQGKWWIIGITFLFAVAGVIYAIEFAEYL
ncbi:MAG: Wzz/FepE/Etk N-terminal domain-containing protein [Marinagarivorans sp.]|nr:Wzz/FepE/Etk N-terminal domain-containing protein [Marinagarivorans sp.]